MNTKKRKKQLIQHGNIMLPNDFLRDAKLNFINTRIILKNEKNNNRKIKIFVTSRFGIVYMRQKENNFSYQVNAPAHRRVSLAMEYFVII